MKCPKCSYVSFDYNLACPKCGKDISADQQRLNLPSFRPDTPLLISSLIGQADDSGANPSPHGSSAMRFAGEAGTVLEDSSSMMETGEIALEEPQELDFSLEAEQEKHPEDSGEFELGTEDKAISELDFKESKDLALDSDGLSLEQDKQLDNSALGIGKEIATDEEKEEDGEIDLETFDLGGKEEGAEQKDDIHLSLDDLKVNETGELELGKEATGDTDKPLEIEEITLDEIPLADELGMDQVSNKAKPEAGPADSLEEGDSLDLEDLNLDLEMEEEPKRT